MPKGCDHRLQFIMSASSSDGKKDDTPPQPWQNPKHNTVTCQLRGLGSCTPASPIAAVEEALPLWPHRSDLCKHLQLNSARGGNSRFFSFPSLPHPGNRLWFHGSQTGENRGTLSPACASLRVLYCAGQAWPQELGSPISRRSL